MIGEYFMKVKVNYEKEISKCYRECPYFGTDGGGPGPVMICHHPEIEKRSQITGNTYEGAIIDHPECDNGFPSECPLIKEYN